MGKMSRQLLWVPRSGAGILALSLHALQTRNSLLLFPAFCSQNPNSATSQIPRKDVPSPTQPFCKGKTYINELVPTLSLVKQKGVKVFICPFLLSEGSAQEVLLNKFPRCKISLALGLDSAAFIPGHLECGYTAKDNLERGEDTTISLSSKIRNQFSGSTLDILNILWWSSFPFPRCGIQPSESSKLLLFPLPSADSRLNKSPRQKVSWFQRQRSTPKCRMGCVQ